MKIRDLKEIEPEIYEKALKEQERQGNHRNDDKNVYESRYEGNFNWVGAELNRWSLVAKGDYAEFKRVNQEVFFKAEHQSLDKLEEGKWYEFSVDDLRGPTFLKPNGNGFWKGIYSHGYLVPKFMEWKLVDDDETIEWLDYSFKNRLSIGYEDNSFANWKRSKSETNLEKAVRLYPIGTRYKPIMGDGSVKDYIRVSEHEPIEFNDGSIHVGLGYIFEDGKWAEIVHEEAPNKKKEVEDECEEESTVWGAVSQSDPDDLNEFYRQFPRTGSLMSYGVQYKKTGEYCCVPGSVDGDKDMLPTKKVRVPKSIK